MSLVRGRGLGTNINNELKLSRRKRDPLEKGVRTNVSIVTDVINLKFRHSIVVVMVVVVVM